MGLGTGYDIFGRPLSLEEQGNQRRVANSVPVGTPMVGGGGVGGGAPAWKSNILDYFGMSQGDAQVIGGAAQGIGAAFGIYNAFQQQKMAKQQFAFQKEAYYTNLRNQKQSYNTQLQDRINGRHSSAERTQEQKQADYEKYKL